MIYRCIIAEYLYLCGMQGSFTFGKSERLSYKSAIEDLFHKGSGIPCYPLRIVWLAREGEEGCKPRILVSVPARTFRKAVDRNLLKRRMREAYRRNNIRLSGRLPFSNRQVDIAFLYIAKEICSYHDIEKGIISGLDAVAERV